MILTEEQKKFWAENGHLPVNDVIPADLVAAERERFEWWCQHWDSAEAQNLNIEHETQAAKSPKTVRKIHKLEQYDDVFRAHIFNKRLLDIVSELIGTPFSLCETQAFLKPPSLGTPKPAHQDNAYFKIDPAGERLMTQHWKMAACSIIQDRINWVPSSTNGSKARPIRCPMAMMKKMPCQNP